MPVMDSISAFASKPLREFSPRNMSASRSSISMRIARSPALRYPAIVSAPAGQPTIVGIVTRPGGGASGNSDSPCARDHSTTLKRVGAGFSNKGMKIVNWPNRIPCLRSAPRASWSSALTSSATAARGKTPSDSTIRNANPLAKPASSSSRCIAISGSNNADTLRSMKCCNRRCTFWATSGPATSSTNTSTMGFNGSAPATSLPTAADPHMRPPCSV